MPFIVLFIHFLGEQTAALIINKNVVFHKANEIALTRSKWFSAFIINLKPYENFLNKLSEDLGKPRITAYSTEQFYDLSSNQDYRGIFKDWKVRL